MTFSYTIGAGADALFWNQIIAAFNETYWSSGWGASVGSGDWDVDIASGDGVVEESSVSTSSTATVTLSSSDSDPRKDVIYINSSGTVQSLEGTAASAEPSGETQADTYTPAPPDASGITGVVVAEVWVGGGASSLSSGDIRDRRIPSPTYADEDAQDAVGTILSSQFTYDDANDAINMDPHVSTADAHHTKPSSTQGAQEAVESENVLVAASDGDGTYTIDKTVTKLQMYNPTGGNNFVVEDQQGNTLVTLEDTKPIKTWPSGQAIGDVTQSTNNGNAVLVEWTRSDHSHSI